MRTFPSSFRYTYIIITVDYVSKRIEAKSIRINDCQSSSGVCQDLQKCGISKAIISDRRTHFCNKVVEHTSAIKWWISYQTEKSKPL